MPTEEKLKTYDEVIKYLGSCPKHLLLGNGFSIGYDSQIFSYNSLSKFVEKVGNETLTKLFNIINTTNFELVMQQLDNVTRIVEAFDADPVLVEKIRAASKQLKESLIDAIKELHPEHVFELKETKSKACAAVLNEFLNNGGNIFTTNYDLLLYWILLRNDLQNKGDGFGRDADETTEYLAPEDRTYSELRWDRNKESQSVHFVHGGLHIFDTGIEIVKEEYTGEWLLNNIKNRLEKKQYPVFVAAGSSNEKLAHIMHNRYLAYCYESLCSISGSLISFGFGFGEYDEHIIAAINKAAKFRKSRNGVSSKLLSLYIGVNSESGFERMKSIRDKFKLPVRYFDTRTVGLWG